MSSLATSWPRGTSCLFSGAKFRIRLIFPTVGHDPSRSRFTRNNLTVDGKLLKYIRRDQQDCIGWHDIAAILQPGKEDATQEPSEGHCADDHCHGRKTEPCRQA